MVTEWLHIDTDVGDPWVLPIWSAVNDAIKQKRIDPLPEKTRKLGPYISIRLDMLPHIVSRINSEVEQIYKVAIDHGNDYVFTKTREGYALPMHEKRELVHFLLADIDALLFETNSVCELMKIFFEKLYSHIGIKVQAGPEIKKILESKGHDSKWFQDLDCHRNFFIHEGAPYLAIDISLSPNNYDLLIMKENLKTFEDSSKFIRLSELNNIVQGFISAKHAIQKHLIEFFRKVNS